MSPRVELRARADELFAYSGRSLAIADRHGELRGQGLEGLYADNTRVLSRARLRADGRPLAPVVASPVEAHALLAHFEVPASRHVPARSVYVELAHFLDGGLRTRVAVASYSREPARFALSLELDADFADVQERARGRREQEAPVERAWDEQRRELRFDYRHGELDRSVAVRVERAPAPVRWRDERLEVDVELGPRGRAELELTVEPRLDGERRAAPPASFSDGATQLGRVREQLRGEAPRLVTTNASVARAWETATADLATLPLGLESGPAAPIAGVPLYQRLFGRDVLGTAFQALLATRTLARDSLRANAAWQGRAIDDWRDEEPGKGVHIGDWGPLAALGVNPHRAYYGDWVTAQNFLYVLGQYAAWTGDRQTVRACLPAARRFEEWLERYGDLDGDGLLEYATRSEKGDRNQGWKDSPTAIVDERGEVVKDPIGTCELQGYWYVGLRQAALAFAFAGDRAYALELLRRARRLRARFEPAFWLERERFYALARGPGNRTIRSIASNAGHLLASAIVPPAKARTVADRLMAPDLFSGWGVRTLSSEHPSYNPFSYHLGSVWPVENATFCLGFARYGLWEHAHRLAEGLFAAADLFVSSRVPEAIGGLPRDERHPHPGVYPKANEPQAWSASMVVLLVQALLGLRPVAPLRLLLVDPHLPEWLPDLRLEGVRVGDARVDLAFERRDGGSTRWRVLRRDGPLRVLRQPMPEGRGRSLTARARAAAASALR